MFRKFCLVLLGLGLLSPVLVAQTVDELIAKNIQARGGAEKIKAVQSIRSSGKMTMGPGVEAPGVMIQKRPDMMRVEFTVQGLTAVQAYDGKSAWMIMPFMGKKDPELMTADDTKDFQDSADIDGPLVDYKAKGHTVELLGKERLEGSDVYKLKLTRKNGDVDIIYLDTDSFLEVKEDQKRNIRGSERETETTLGDYKEVNGLMFPFAIQQGIKGSPQQQQLSVEKVELNVPVDATIFKMPAAAPPPAADKPKAATPTGK